MRPYVRNILPLRHCVCLRVVVSKHGRAKASSVIN